MRDHQLNRMDSLDLVDKDICITYPRLGPPEVNLTKRESECFYLLSRVPTIKKIARILGLSPRTIEMYIDQIKRKLGLLYKSEVIEVAIALSNQYVVEE